MILSPDLGILLPWHELAPNVWVLVWQRLPDGGKRADERTLNGGTYSTVYAGDLPPQTAAVIYLEDDDWTWETAIDCDELYDDKGDRAERLERVKARALSKLEPYAMREAADV
jgi:hypothetical protein